MSRELSVGFLCLERERKGDSNVKTDKIRVHGKEILMDQSIVIYMLYLLYGSKCCMTIF